ncbi:MAG: hypothetical protein IPK19_01040 [Chloroflexi bacterium]|nr:hypothetical protein [Chloroflexota bacterium]
MQDSVTHPESVAQNPVPEKARSTVEEFATEAASALPPARSGRGQMPSALKGLESFERNLNRLSRRSAQSSLPDGAVASAREWLLDNDYIVQRALRQVEADLPEEYYRELPKLSGGPLDGLARVYVAARSFTEFAEGQVAAPSAEAFLVHFQETAPLTMGELWAWPTMLRLCALENLTWALEQTAESVEFSDRFSAAVTDRLREHHPEPQMLVGASITGLRLLNTRDWPDSFEAVSRVEAILRRDPAGVYPLMDFETRNQYRGVIEKLAIATERDEEQIADTVLLLAREVMSRDGQGSVGHSAESALPFVERRDAHVGYFLIDDGRRQLIEALGDHPSLLQRLGGGLKPYRTALYIAAILAITLLITLVMAAYAWGSQGTAAQIVVAGLVAILPASVAAVHLVNWLVVRQTKPSRLPKLDFSEGLPAAFRGLVVIPSLLTDAEEVQSLAAQLELHFLRNPDPHLRFAVLADFTDAPEEQAEGDDALITLARNAVDALNAQHGTDQNRPFYFFLRRRQWNPAEDCWMGYERKRGKLEEFNQILLDPEADTSFFVRHGDLRALAGTRYVITLDADTIMPHRAAQRLVGTLAHPLNRPVFEPGTQRVTAGYTVLQPRVELLPSVKNRSVFAHIMGGDTGFDLYTLAASDVYQDLFDEGIYVGKGIYDVAAFERSLRACVPENALLSHDLFEGIHGRAGLVTDIVLVEDYPTHYLAFTKRLHRWIRGDWQLLPWLMPRVPRAGGVTAPNPLSALSRWKIFDNLRRSLERPALLLLFAMGWLWLPGSPFVWTVVGLLVLWLPFMVGVVTLAVANTATARLTRAHETRISVLIARWSLTLIFLPYEATVVVDAIVRTLIRLARRRRLLEWSTAAATMQALDQSGRNRAWRQMLNGLLLTGALGLGVMLLRPAAFLPAFPLLTIWMAAPYFAARLSRPYWTEPTPERLPEDALRQLRMVARRTWLFFEAFVGADDRWLPPDHYQQDPNPRVKHYTSPTNIGLMLLSTLGARDLGYIGTLELVLRVRFAFDTIAQLERHRGHLLNWYQTQSLDSLKPRYVSTVDSGNYAGCLMTLSTGLRDLLSRRRSARRAGRD